MAPRQQQNQEDSTAAQDETNLMVHNQCPAQYRQEHAAAANAQT